MVQGTKAARSLLFLGLLAAAEETQARRFRTLRISGLMLAASGVLGVTFVAVVGASDVADVVALRLLAYGAWLYGLIGLPALMSPAVQSGQMRRLAELRGFEPGSQLARPLGRAVHLFVGMTLASLPGLLVAFAFSPQGAVLLQRAGLIVVALFYLAALAATLAMVAWLCERLAPQAPRMCALALVFGPWLAALAFDGVPNLIDGFSWLLSKMIAWGGTVT